MYLSKYVCRVCVCVFLCVWVYSDDREYGFPTRLFSWCRVQRTRSVGTRCLVTANDSRDNSISYNSFT